MYKYVLLILLILTIRSQSEAQISNNASGNDIYSQYGSISYSVGELFYVQKGTEYTVTEGIQNGFTIHPSHNKTNIKVTVYPNPTSDFIFFKVQDLYFDNLSYKIFNNNGKELLNGTIQNINTSVSLNHLPPSVYLCKIYRKQSEILTYQIIKIN